MRIDVVSIFPDYLTPLELSLPGKARASGLLEVTVHDLRDWTMDRHRTVDDSPYGGGAGMVMKPEPWGAALDALGADEAIVVVPTPSGTPFTQELASELSTQPRLIFACGRYEGIDQRVMDHYRSRTRLLEVSLGDFVLNGGEVAALAMIEAVVRLIPGFMGNAASLEEESHEDGLLEYPVFTKPARWRELEVPAVLTSGDHGAIARWRHEQRVRRTAQRRPDLLHHSAVSDAPALRTATRGDAGELLTLQRACRVQEQQTDPEAVVHARQESLTDLRAWLAEWTVLVAHRGERLVAAARARATGEGRWEIGRLMVVPDLQGQGLGRWMLEQTEAAAAAAAEADVQGFEVFTGAGSARNIKRYRKAGYRPAGSPAPGIVRLTKPLRRISV